MIEAGLEKSVEFALVIVEVKITVPERGVGADLATSKVELIVLLLLPDTGGYPLPGIAVRHFKGRFG